MAIVLALLASCCWGVADFTGGLKSRRIPVLAVMFLVEGTGMVLVLALIVIEGTPLPGTVGIVYSLLAGAAGIVALGAFYRALAIGTMSIVAPISAAGVAIPVVVGIVTGNHLSLVVSLGLAVTVAGVALASREIHEDEEAARAGRTSILLALAAAVGFGGYFALSDRAADSSILWLLVLSRLAVVPAIGAILLARRVPPPARADALTLVGAGTLDVTATGLYALANTKGALAIVSVVGSMYPISTVLLARAILGERLRPIQAAGVVAALGGVALIAAG
jgi:drug/metabolite transporter (DMT)-like permease